MKERTHRSRTGPKLYAVTDKKSRFKDILAYVRAHERDLKRKAR